MPPLPANLGSAEVDLLAVHLDQLLGGHERVLRVQAHVLLGRVVDTLGPELVELLHRAIAALDPLAQALEHARDNAAGRYCRDA